MGMTMSIGLYAEQPRIPQVYTALVGRMLKHGSVIETHFFDWGSSEPEERKPDEILAHVEDTAAELLESRKQLVVSIDYQLASGRALWLDLRCSGSGYEAGYAVRNNGYLRLTFELTDLAYATEELWTLWDERPVAERVVRWGPNLHDAEALFLHACGIHGDTSPDTVPAHAALYMEYGWPSPATCGMLYHRDVAEFAHDFGRIYADYHFGTAIPYLLEPSRDVWRISEAELSRFNPPGRNYPSGYQQFSIGREDALLDFLNSLDRPTAEALSTLSGEVVRELLRDIHRYAPEVHSHDFGPRGLALTTHPLGGIWRAFQRLATVAQS